MKDIQIRKKIMSGRKGERYRSERDRERKRRERERETER